MVFLSASCTSNSKKKKINLLSREKHSKINVLMKRAKCRIHIMKRLAFSQEQMPNNLKLAKRQEVSIRITIRHKLNKLLKVLHSLSCLVTTQTRLLWLT